MAILALHSFYINSVLNYDFTNSIYYIINEPTINHVPSDQAHAVDAEDDGRQRRIYHLGAVLHVRRVPRQLRLLQVRALLRVLSGACGNACVNQRGNLANDGG